MELDKDLLARQEARALAKEAQKAQRLLAQMEQSQLDTIVEAVAKAFAAEAGTLAELAVRETGFGNVKDKIRKNEFASQGVAQAVRGMKAVGLLGQNAGERVWEYGVPMGVIAAIVPSTNPTSTVAYKSIIALKSGNAIVFSPHPKASECTRMAARIVAQAAEAAGAPKGAVGCLSVPALAGCQELMSAPETSLILATGGPAMVKAAYSSGKPAIGVGAGNGPAYIHPSADVRQALEAILESKTFDNGTVCASEQSIICQKQTEQAILEEGAALGFYLMGPEEAEKLGRLLFRGNGTLNPEIVGKTAIYLAEKAGFSVPKTTKVLLARESQAGPSRPYSMEKLCPVLAFYVMDSEEAVLETCIRILDHEGSGHTFSLHCNQEDVVKTFAARIPVSRILVNTGSALGGIGASTNLFPALTLGCGAVGGSSSSNNVSPMDLINIRRVAWGREERQAPRVNDELIDFLTRKIMERLG